MSTAPNASAPTAMPETPAECGSTPCAPVIFMAFNRPDCTRRVLERIRAARPQHLFVVCDGPRVDHPTDGALVAEVRRVITEGVDWPCVVECDFAETNMGCRLRVSSGLTAAFERFDEAIVLEDDTLPDPTFFPYCTELLAHYRDDERIMHICGANYAAPYIRGSASYWFAHQSIVWGWATWRRAWRHYDLEMTTWDTRAAALRASFTSRWEMHFWLPIFDRARLHPEEANTWDFSWNYTCRSLRTLCIVPRDNLVENIGFGADSTHTADVNSSLQLPAVPTGRLKHPDRIKWNRYADELLTMIWGGLRVDLAARLWARLRVWHGLLRG